MPPELLEALAGEVVLLIKGALTPVLERLAAAEARVALTLSYEQVLGELRDLVGSLRERVAGLEARPLLPGPPGEPGPAGTNGLDGKDGTAGLTYVGVYQDGKSYEPGELATWAGSTWYCHTATTTKPGDGSKDWQLMVKRGRDGKDGVDAPGALPVVKVGGTR